MIEWYLGAHTGEHVLVSCVLKGTDADACGGNDDKEKDEDDEGLVQLIDVDDGSLAQRYGEVLVQITVDGRGSLESWYGEFLVPNLDVGRGSLDIW